MKKLDVITQQSHEIADLRMKNATLQSLLNYYEPMAHWSLVFMVVLAVGCFVLGLYASKIINLIKYI